MSFPTADWTRLDSWPTSGHLGSLSWKFYFGHERHWIQEVFWGVAGTKACGTATSCAAESVGQESDDAEKRQEELLADSCASPWGGPAWLSWILVQCILITSSFCFLLSIWRVGILSHTSLYPHSAWCSVIYAIEIQLQICQINALFVLENISRWPYLYYLLKRTICINNIFEHTMTILKTS